VDSFDQSLKYLLHQEPEDFSRFALRDPTVQVLGPVASGLPTRGREIDGAYYIRLGEEDIVAHHEFHRHQSIRNLAIDVGEAQIRMHRREDLAVVSLVWDLYGAPAGEVVEERSHAFGKRILKKRSRVVYLRVNLRALGWRALLAEAPPALWPLVALTRDGASEEAVRKAREAIGARTDLGGGQKADHLAVLWFVADAEHVPVRMMKELITEEELSRSALYQSIFEARGEVRTRAETIIRILMRRMGGLAPAIRERIRSVQDLETLKAWQEDALGVLDADGAQRLAEKIQNAVLS